MEYWPLQVTLVLQSSYDLLTSLYPVRHWFIVFAEMAKQLRKAGKSVFQHLQDLYARYGHFLTLNSYCLSYDQAVTNKIFTRLRNGGSYWHKVGKFKIDAIRDLTSPGFDSNYSDLRPHLPTASDTQMITYTLSNGCVFTLRTSGTGKLLHCKLI